MEPHRLLALFVAEGRDLLSRVDAELLVLERAPETRGAIDAVFRALHSLKGMSATVSLETAAAALHAGESLLASARDMGQLDHAHVAALFTLTSRLRVSFDAAERGDLSQDALDDSLRELEALAPRATTVHDTARRRARAERVVQHATSTQHARWRVEVLIAEHAAAPQARATIVLRRLTALAPVLTVTPDSDAQGADDWDRRFTVWLGDPADGASLDGAALEQAVRAAGDIARVHASRDVVTATDASAAEASASADSRTVRIPAQRLDDLLDLVGELVIARDRLLRTVRPNTDDAGRIALDDTSRLVLQLRDAILHSRLVPLSQVFDRFPRLVRDTAHALGKEVELVLEGRDLEVDRSLLDELGEPVLHLLRNAVDHGLEGTEERVAAGKDARGRIVVRAVRDGSMVAVTVADDGRGVNRARVAASAARQGVIDADALAHDDQGLLQLLARPGLSTATEVTAVSGRGVGVDAVLSRVHALGGRIELATADGAGTAFTLRLPLSVAMLRALLVRVANETYAIPLALIHATVLADGLRGHGRALPADVDLAGTRVRLVSLRAHLGLPVPDDVSGHLVVLDGASGRVALLVDACLSQHEIVVKPLQRVRGAAAMFSGGTILPDGTPSLILDINTLP
jgi:two-component system, chemotaxis family, sensor kinase CheA